MLSSIRKNEILDSGKIHYQTGTPIRKPASVIDYNKNMGLIDKSDMQMSFNESTRKSTKWYKKALFHFLDLAVYNAYIIFKLKSTQENLQLPKFRINLIRQLLEEFAPTRPSSSGGRKSKDQENPLRLTVRHFPNYPPPTPNKPKPRRKCHVCANTSLQAQKRRETPMWCKDCEVPLCVPECFRVYHTKRNF